MNGCYVYGVVAGPDANTEVTELPAVGRDPDARVSWVRHEGLAAAVSPLGTDEPLGTPADLRAHAGLLDALAAQGAPVLPFRFGTVLRDEQEVAGRILGDGHDAFTAALDRLRGRAQFTVRARYEQDAVLREVLGDRPDIAELREQVAGVPEEAGRYERIRLGELVAQSLEERRAADATEVHRRLAPAADAALASQPPEEDAIGDFAFLVADDRRAAFERAAEELAGDWHDRARLRLLGPLAPYDFVTEAMGDAQDRPVAAGTDSAGAQVPGAQQEGRR